MKSSLFRREAAAILSCRSFAVAAWLHASLLAVFLLGWTTRLTPLASMNAYEQVVAFDVVILTALLPWVASRCMARERGNGLVFLSLLTGAAPSRIIAARAGAIAVSMGLVALTGLPILILAQRIAGSDSSRVMVDALGMLSIGVACPPWVILWRQTWSSRNSAWLAAALSVALVVAVTRWRPGVSGSFVGMGASLLLVGAVALRADVSSRYLRLETHAS